MVADWDGRIRLGNSGMSRRFDCPWDDYPGAYIELPDSWLGEHAARRDTAREAANEADLPSTFVDFSVCMALLDDWQLPGLTGNPDNWDFNQLDLRIINWVTQVTLVDFSKCWVIPKNSLSPSPNGSTETETIEAPGDMTAK
jgi:hypothetical protein